MSSVLSVELPRTPQAPFLARRALEDLDGRLDPKVLPDVRLLVSELITNSVKYGGEGPVRLEVAAGEDSVRAEIIDQGVGFTPKARDGDLDRVGGWGLHLTEEGNATSIHAFVDDLLLINMSVWESVDALAAYVYGPDHVAVMRRRREWAERMEEAYLVLWWIPAGTIPTIDEAKERLQHLRDHGPAPLAFTFKKRFAPDEALVASPEDERWFCPA